MEKENNVKKNFLVLVAIFLIIVIGGILITQQVGKTPEEKSIGYLKNYLKRIDVTNATPTKSNIALGQTTLKDELPDIDQYDLTVKGNEDSDRYINIEIFSSPEKSGDGTDGWLKEVAENFNNERYTISDKQVSVSVRNISSGDAVDYIVSGKYVPELFAPSNELWAAMVEAKSVNLTKIADSLVQNTAGILISQSTYKTLESKYGKADLSAVVQATTNGEISFGYTNPYASSTGLNLLISTLSYFDSENPLSENAKEGFQKFQENIPFVSYNTMQMRSAAESGSLDAFIMEYQTYENDPTLKNNYTFIPFGIPHNNPLYACGTISEEKRELIELFAKYALESEQQSLARNYGFNQNMESSDSTKYDGNTILQAQQLWKEEKDSGKPIIAVFVADVSGSMSGTPLSNLKKSLINGGQYINKNNYIGLVSYSSDVTIELPINQFDINQRSYFNNAIQGLSASGNTATFDAIMVATNMLLEKKEEIPDAKMMMFVLSDGETNVGCKLEDATKVVKNLNIPIYTIGYNANITALGEISNINEAASINADSEDVIYQLRNLFNSNL